MARGIGGVGLSEDLAGAQRIVVNLGDHRLVTVVVLGESGERTEVIVADDHHVDTGHGGDVIGVGNARGSFDHDHHQHVVVYGLAVIDAVDSPYSRRLAAACAA